MFCESPLPLLIPSLLCCFFTCPFKLPAPWESRQHPCQVQQHNPAWTFSAQFLRKTNLLWPQLLLIYLTRMHWVRLTLTGWGFLQRPFLPPLAHISSANASPPPTQAEDIWISEHTIPLPVSEIMLCLPSTDLGCDGGK